MKPAIVIAHGAWHVPEHFDKFAQALRARGFDVHIPQLPTSSKLAAQSKLEDDVKVISDLLDELKRKSRQVIVMAHSYGGVPTTQALKGRCDNNVLHLVYICAFMLQPGEELASASKPRPEPDPVVVGDDGTSFPPQGSPKTLFYGDLDEETAARAEKLLQRHSLAAFIEPIDYPAWRHVPTTYIRTLRDGILLQESQERMVKAVQDAGVDLDVQVLDSDHSPFLSKTAEMVNVVEGIASKYEAQS